MFVWWWGGGREACGWEPLDIGVNNVTILPTLNKQEPFRKVRVKNLWFPKGSALILSDLSLLLNSVLNPIKVRMPHSMVRTS